jgi:hypothetical protein
MHGILVEPSMVGFQAFAGALHAVLAARHVMLCILIK